MKNSTLAAWRTAGAVTGVVLGCFLVHLTVTLVPSDVILRSLSCLLAIAGVYGVYRFILLEIESEQKLAALTGEGQRIERRGADRTEFPTIQE